MRTVKICGMLFAQCTMLWVRFEEIIAACALLVCVSHASTVLSKHEVGVELLFCLVFWDRGCGCARGRGGTLWHRLCFYKPTTACRAAGPPSCAVR